MKLDFGGGQELEQALREIADVGARRRAAERALRRGAEIIRDEAKILAPDAPESGPGRYLREAIKVGKRADMSVRNRQFRASQAGRQMVEIYVGIDGSVLPPREPKTDRRRRRSGGGSSGGAVAAYSIFVEHGTSSMKAQPYMRPAFDRTRDQVLSEIGGMLGDEIAKTAARAARKAARKG